MATGTLAPSPVFTAFDNNGLILPLAKLYVYVTGTVTPATVYTDAAMLVAHPNPVIMDTAGRATIYLPAASYKVILKTAADATIYTVDPVASTALVQSGLGELYAFGGDPNSPVVATSYPSGTGGDKLHAGSRIIPIDSAVLASGGTFRLSSMLKGEGGGTATLALVNLTDGSPDTALVEISSSSTTGVRQQSAAITFPSGGASKDFGIKLKASSGAAYAWMAALERTA